MIGSIRMRWIYPALAICFGCSAIWSSCLAQGTIYVSGTYPGTTTWSADTVKVTGWVSADTLIIEPGTIVEFQTEYGLYINKRLYANGAIGDTILFTAKDTSGFSNPNLHTGGWGGIGGRNIRLKYCRIQYVKKFTKYGAAIKGEDFVEIQNSCIINNFSIGIYLEFCSVNVNKSIIRNNSRGGIFSHSFGRLFLENSIVDFNGTYGIKAIESHRLYVDKCNIQNNDGSGIIFTDYEALFKGIISNNIISYNKGDGLGLDMFSRPIVNNLIVGNSKAGILLGNSCNTLVNNTVINNSGGIISFDGCLALYNSICRNNVKSQGDQNVKGASKIFNSNIQEFNTDNFYGEFINNIDEDPLFVDSANFDFHLSENSPCINAGTSDTTGLFIPKTDLDGSPRIVAGRIDMGAFEFHGTTINKAPRIEKIKDQQILPSSTEIIRIKFYDPDSGDFCTLLGVFSDTPEIKVTDPADSMNYTRFVIAPDSGWRGNGIIQIRVTDNHGNIGLQEFKVIVSNRVCGFIKKNTIWNADTVIVACDVTVSNYVTLTIKPGTVVAFDNNCVLNVYGSIIAAGSKDSLITFKSIDTAGFYNQTYTGWKGIRLTGKGKAEFRYCDFLYAKNEGNGGALYSDGYYPLKITNCKFINNYSGIEGGALCIERNLLEFKNNIFINNYGKYVGGAVYISESNIDIVNNLFYNNQAQSGSAIYARSDSRLINNTIVGNSADKVNLYRGTIKNCIIWGTKSQTINSQVTFRDSASVGNCIIEGGINGINYEKSPPIVAGPVYSVDPAFLNETLYNFHLADTSVGINSGTIDTTGLNLTAFDLDGNLRIFDGRIDMGAYEYQHDNFRILKQPVSRVICEGAAVTLETEAIGGVVGYQWQKNGVDIPSAHQRTLTYGTVSINDAGYYNCLIIADDKTVSTDTISLLVDTGLTIESQTHSFSVCPGKDTLLHVTVCGSCRRDYTWSKNDQILPDATESRLIIHAPAIQQQDIYFSTVFNACGTVKSENIIVTASNIPDPPVSHDTAICEGQPVPDLHASGDHIKWYGDAELSNPVDTGSSFTTGQSKHGLYIYYATQTASGCESNTATVKLTINMLPVISLGNDSTINTNQNFTLGPYPDSYSYLWNNDSVNAYFEISGSDLGTGSHNITVLITDTNTCQNSDTMIVHVVPVTHINLTQNNNLLHIFPNPTDGLLNVELSDFHEKDIIITLYNQQGEAMMSNKLYIENKGGTIQLNISSYPAGIYYLQVIMNSRQYFGKVVLMN